MNLWMSPELSLSVRKPPTKSPCSAGSTSRISSGRQLAPDQPALGQQAVDHAGVREVLLPVVEMQDAAPLEVEVDALARGHLEQHRAGGDGEPHGLDGVGLVARDVRQELGHPADLVQRRPRVDEQRRVGLQHPLQALQHGAPLGPDLGVRGRQLAAVGEARLHRGVAVAVEDRHLEAAVQQFIGGRQAGHAGADHGNSGHGSTLQGSGGCAAECPLRALDLRVSPEASGFLLRWALAGRFPEC